MNVWPARKAKPAGLIRMSCPAAIVQLLIGPLIPPFISRHPEVRIAIDSTNRKADLENNRDLSIRVCQMPSEDSRMVMRSLGIIQQVLVASRAFLERHGRPSCPTEASQLNTLSYGSLQGPHVWKLVDRQDQDIQSRHELVLIIDDMMLIRQSVMQGLGIAQLPLAFCRDEIKQGHLEVVLPEYVAPLCEIQVVFPTRRGMLPTVRSFIDFLSAHCIHEVEAQQIKRHTSAGERESVRFWTNRQPVDQLTQSQDHLGVSLDCTVGTA